MLLPAVLGSGGGLANFRPAPAKHKTRTVVEGSDELGGGSAVDQDQPVGGELAWLTTTTAPP